MELLPDVKARRYLVYLKFWTINFMPVMVYSKVLLHPNFIILGIAGRNQEALHVAVHKSIKAGALF